jgi:hypothetical protein
MIHGGHQANWTRDAAQAPSSKLSQLWAPATSFRRPLISRLPFPLVCAWYPTLSSGSVAVIASKAVGVIELLPMGYLA